MKSLTFTAASAQQLYRTNGAPTSATKFTAALWIKRASISSGTQSLISEDAANSDSGYGHFAFAANAIMFAGWSTIWRSSTATFTDTSGWHHWLVAVDTSQATANNRIRIYYDGVEITSFGTLNNPALNATVGINLAAIMRLGTDGLGGLYFNGKMAEFYFVDGQQLTPSSFTRIDAGVIRAIPYAGTLGANGCHLSFANAASTTTLGFDDGIGSEGTHGGSNDWTLFNMSTANSSADSPASAWFGSAHLSGAGSLHADGKHIGPAGAIVLSGEGSLAVTGSVGVVGRADLAGTGTMAFSQPGAHFKGAGYMAPVDGHVYQLNPLVPYGGDVHVRRNGDDYAEGLAALLPQGVAWPRLEGKLMTKVIGGLAQIFGYFDGRAADLLERESDPRQTIELLPDWERNWGLPDKCMSETLTIDDRHRALVTRMTLLGSQSRQFFIDAAASIGNKIRIREYSPFMCGISRCGDTRNQWGDWRWQIGPVEMRFYWTVQVGYARLSWFRCGSGQAGVDPHLRIGLATDVECLLRRWGPSHTQLVFDYSGLVTGGAMAGTP